MESLEIMNIKGIECYEKDGIAYLKLETVARGLGFTTVAASGNEVIRWNTVHKYLSDLGVATSCNGSNYRECCPDFIPENIFYRLAMKAKNAVAEVFQAKIADEVIPSIRKHGAYMTPDTLDKMITSPEFGIKLLTALKEEQEKRKALEMQNTALSAENEAQRQVIADFEPIKQYVDTILSSNRTLTTTQIAADYDMSAKRLNRILFDEGIQRYVNGQWILYKKHMGKGYTKSKTINITHSDGRPDTVLNTEWTQKGRLKINEILNARGILAVMDRTIV